MNQKMNGRWKITRQVEDKDEDEDEDKMQGREFSTVWGGGF